MNPTISGVAGRAPARKKPTPLSGSRWPARNLGPLYAAAPAPHARPPTTRTGLAGRRRALRERPLHPHSQRLVMHVHQRADRAGGGIRRLELIEALEDQPDGLLANLGRVTLRHDGNHLPLGRSGPQPLTVHSPGRFSFLFWTTFRRPDIVTHLAWLVGCGTRRDRPGCDRDQDSRRGWRARSGGQVRTSKLRWRVRRGEECEPVVVAAVEQVAACGGGVGVEQER